MKKAGDMLVVFLMLFIGFSALSLFGIDPAAILALIEWATKFVLPWLFLYEFVRLVKALEKKKMLKEREEPAADFQNAKSMGGNE